MISVLAVKGYRSVCSSIFKSILSEMSTSDVLHDLTRSFKISTPMESP